MSKPAPIGKWWVCGLLLLALMLNYMDRQTLSLTIQPIKAELELTATQYGRLEKGFGYAFAVGGILAGLIADKVSVRWLYPAVLFGWSLAGVATGFADKIGTALAPLIEAISPAAIDPSNPSDCAYWGFMICRIVLGLFEAGQWPCALITTQRLLSSADRPFGNSVLQSGASIGAILTPQVVSLLVTSQPGSWRNPFVVVGVTGLLWIVPWLWMTRGLDLSRREESVTNSGEPTNSLSRGVFISRYIALIAVVVTINLPWHFFRAWMPLMLQEFHKYEASVVRHFTSAYYIATDVGCITAGLLIKVLIAKGRSVHTSRVLVFTVCTLLTMLSMVAAEQARGPVLLGLLLVIGFGALGLFPIYYSLTQELSTRHQGKVTGSLSFITWAVSAEMQELVGKRVDATKSYADGLFWVGLAPLIGLIALVVLWNVAEKQRPITQSNSNSSDSSEAQDATA